MPVILCTGFMDEIAAKAAPTEFPVLVKPYRQADLAERLRQAFAGSS